MSDWINKCHFGDNRDTLRSMIAAGVKVQCAVTSPPYFGLRSYGIGSENGELGLEATPAEYVANMVEVFELVRELLADDGVLFLNLGDSYSTAVANITDMVKRELERGIIFFGSADPRGRSAERINVLVYDKRAPNLIFTPLFTTQRICIKQGQHDLCEIGGFFNPPVECFSSCVFDFARPDYANTEFFVNLPEHVGVVVTAGDLRADAALRNTIALTVKDRKAPLSIEISAEPVSEGVSSSVPAFDTVTFNAVTKSGSEVDVVNDAVTFLDRSHFGASHRGDFAVRESSDQKLSLTLHGGADVCFFGIGHLFLLGGGLTPYKSILEKAQQSFNESRPKQELGIPEMVKRALMRDGWICRQTIIWAKPNPMPESVTDRCTKAHEYLFLLSKSERYYWDAQAMQEQAKAADIGAMDGGAQRLPDGANANDGRNFRPGRSGNHERKPASARGVPIDTGGKSAGAVAGSVPREGFTRNRRSVWTVPTVPYSGKKALTDYVGDDGKPYTASPDCPIHGHLARRQKSGTPGYGGQQGQSQTGSSGTYTHLSASPAFDEQSTICHSSQASSECNSQRHTPENMRESRTDFHPTERTSGEESQSCSECNSASGEHLDCGTDYSLRECSSTAIFHSTETSKTALSPETSQPCMPCAETGIHTQSTSDPRELFEQGHGTCENSISTAGSGAHPSQDIHNGNTGTSSELASVAYKVENKCTCNEVIIDHFATFPPALIEPCILAGSRSGDTVLDCFFGSGTTGEVAGNLGRNWIGCELNPDYAPLQQARTAQRGLAF